MATTTAAPYQFLDRGDAKGLNVDLLRAVGQRLGRPVEIRLVSPAEAFKQVADGTGHGLLMLTHSPERERVWDFSEPLYS